PRIHIPRQPERPTVNDIRLTDTGKVVLAVDHAARLDARRQIFEAAECRELRDPRVSELADIRQRVAGECRKELFVGGGPRNLLNANENIRMRGLKLVDQRQGSFTL